MSQRTHIVNVEL